MKLNLIAGLLFGILVGTVTAQQRKPTLADFASTKADITKLDWVLLKAEVEVMKSTQAVSDVGWPSYGYDRSQNRLWANVFVNDRWWAQADTKTAKDKLELNGMLYCSSPFLVDQQLEDFIKNKATGCEVNFYTWGRKGDRTDLATFFADRSILILR